MARYKLFLLLLLLTVLCGCSFLKTDTKGPCAIDANRFLSFDYYARIDCTDAEARKEQPLPATIEAIDSYLRSIRNESPTAEVLVTVEVDGKKDANLSVEPESEAEAPAEAEADNN